MTKRDVIIKASTAYSNAIEFASAGEFKAFIRYYGEACAWVELLEEECDVLLKEENWLQEMEDYCLEIYIKLEVSEE